MKHLLSVPMAVLRSDCWVRDNLDDHLSCPASSSFLILFSHVISIVSSPVLLSRGILIPALFLRSNADIILR